MFGDWAFVFRGLCPGLSHQLPPALLYCSPLTAYCLLLTEMSTIQKDFDRIALSEASTEASVDGATHNDHYHNFLLRHLPSNCHDVLEIGCGTGAFARRLAERAGAGSAGILPAMSAQREKRLNVSQLTLKLTDLDP